MDYSLCGNRRTASSAMAGAALCAIPLGVAVLIGFGTSISGVAGGLAHDHQRPRRHSRRQDRFDRSQRVEPSAICTRRQGRLRRWVEFRPRLHHGGADRGSTGTGAGTGGSGGSGGGGSGSSTTSAPGSEALAEVPPAEARRGLPRSVSLTSTCPGRVASMTP